MTIMEKRIAALEAKVQALEAQRRPGPKPVVVFQVVDDPDAPHTPVPQEQLDAAQAEAEATGASVAFVWHGGGPSPDGTTFRLLGRKVEDAL
jgi:hypothetical protein